MAETVLCTKKDPGTELTVYPIGRILIKEGTKWISILTKDSGTENTSVPCGDTL